mmetsp:Transcript_22380/g.58419  ORF Transcript_22380/g.58419 Transcript_22380/m.58419 type:complete len:662 (+) Transcript_22380:817-2802(+)
MMDLASLEEELASGGNSHRRSLSPSNSCDVPLDRCASGKSAAAISRDHFWAHYSKHAETMKRKEEEEQELLAKDPLHFARRPSESAGLRFGTFTDVDIHVRQRISEFGNVNEELEEGEDAPPARSLWMEMYERDQAASRIQAWWRRLHGYAYIKEEDKPKPARAGRRGPQRRVTMSGSDDVVKARDRPMLRRAISFRVEKEEQRSPQAAKGPPPPLRRMASTSKAMGRSLICKSSSATPASSEDGQHQELRRRSSTNLLSEDCEQDDLSPWCDTELRLETGTQGLRRRSSTNLQSEDGPRLHRWSSVTCSQDDTQQPQPRRQSRGGSQQGGSKADGRGAAASARRRSVSQGRSDSDASSDPRWNMQKDASAAVSGPSSEAGSVDCGPGQDAPIGSVLYHQWLHRLQQQNRLAGLGPAQTSLPIRTPTASLLVSDPSIIPSTRSCSQEMEVPKAPLLCLGNKLEPRRSLSSLNLLNHSSSLLASPEQKPVVTDTGLKSKCSGSMDASLLSFSPSDQASVPSRARSVPAAERSSLPAAGTASSTSLAYRSSDHGGLLRHLPDIHQHSSATGMVGTPPASGSGSSACRLRRHSMSNAIPNPFEAVQLDPASEGFLHSGVAAGSSKSRSPGALQPMRLQSTWATSMPLGNQGLKFAPHPPPWGHT